MHWSDKKRTLARALTGSLLEFGIEQKQGVEVGVDLINTAGGIKSLGGAKVKVIFADTQSDPTVAVSETERLIATYKISGFLGAYASSHTIATSEVTERAKIPWVTDCVADAITGRGFKYIFRIAPKGSEFASSTIAALVDIGTTAGKPAKKVAIRARERKY